MAVIGSESCGLKHVVRVIHMSDADLRVCCFLGHDETHQSTHCSHHFKQRACLCLFSQCCVFRKADRIPPSVWRGSCWPLKECNFHVSRVRTSVSQRWNAPFHVFAFVCLSFKKAQERPHCKVHGMRCCIKYCGATFLVPTSNFL